MICRTSVTVFKLNRHLCKSSRAESHPESFKSILLSLSPRSYPLKPLSLFPFFGSFSTLVSQSRHLLPLSPPHSSLHGTCSRGCSSIPSMAPIILGQHSPPGVAAARLLLPRGSKDNSCSTFPMAAPSTSMEWRHVAPLPPARHPPPPPWWWCLLPSLEWRQWQSVQGLALALIPSQVHRLDPAHVIAVLVDFCYCTCVDLMMICGLYFIY